MPSRTLDVGVLDQVELFGGVDDADLVTLARVASRREYQAGEEIIGADERRDGLFMILRGDARAVRTSVAGDELTIGCPSTGLRARLGRV